MTSAATAKPKLPIPAERDQRVVGPAPNGWAHDPLTAFLDGYRGNQLSTFVNMPNEVRDLVRIDGLFRRLLDGAMNLRPFFPANFALRAHSAYLAAAGAVMAGQIYEAQALLRLCLEHSAYGFYIGGDKKLWELWQARSDSQAAKQAAKDKFTHNKVRNHIKAASPTMGDQFARLYEQLIDFGAHPNEQGFAINSSVVRDGDDVHFYTIYLQEGGIPMDHGLKTAARVGLWALHILQMIYPERFELLGIRAELEEMRGQF